MQVAGCWKCLLKCLNLRLNWVLCHGVFVQVNHVIACLGERLMNQKLEVGHSRGSL